MLKSARKTLEINRGKPTVAIGERINPTGRKQVLEALGAGNFDLIRQDAIQQVDAGAAVLDVNAGVPGADEVSLLPRVMEEVMSVVDVPLCIDTANPKALEAALRLYPGKALINSTNGEEKKLETVLPLAKQFGAAAIGLCMDDSGIPPTPEERVAAAEKIICRASKYGIPMADIIIDPLAMTMGSDHGHANSNIRWHSATSGLQPHMHARGHNSHPPRVSSPAVEQVVDADPASASFYPGGLAPKRPSPLVSGVTF